MRSKIADQVWREVRDNQDGRVWCYVEDWLSERGIEEIGDRVHAVEALVDDTAGSCADLIQDRLWEWGFRPVSLPEGQVIDGQTRVVAAIARSGQ